MRAATEKTPTMTVKQATEVMDNCMKVLYYRDARSLNKVGSTYFIFLEVFMGCTHR